MLLILPIVGHSRSGFSKFLKYLIHQGMHQGMQGGMQQGKHQDEAQILLRQPSLRFVEIPADKKRLVESADTESLMRWSERILFANSLDEVLQLSLIGIYIRSLVLNTPPSQVGAGLVEA